MLNRIMAIGNVGTDPDMRYAPSGKPVTQFRFAITHRSGPNDARKEETEWFTVVAWDRLAEQCSRSLAKGKRTYVEGRFRSRTWTGQDGKERHVNEILAERVLFLDRPADRPDSDDGGVPAGLAANATPDDLPF